MKKILILCIVFCFGYSQAQQKPISPKVIAEWYLKATANHDSQSITNLTNYFKATEMPELYFSHDKIEEKAYRSTLSDLIDYPMSYESVIRESMYTYYLNLNKLAFSTSCKILSITPPKQDPDSEERSIIVDVSYQCTCKKMDLTNVPEITYSDEALTIKRYFEAMNAAAKTAKETKTFEGEFRLYETEENNKKYWYSADVEGVIDGINNNLFGDYYDEEVMNAAAEAVDAAGE